MSNDTPPHACLADFNFITTVLDPGHKLSCSGQITGGTTEFMSPEILVPGIIGAKTAKPTPQSDIYAFGMVIFQVCERDYKYQLCSCVLSPGPPG